MANSIGQCQQCGGNVSTSGRCPDCGADQSVLTSANVASFVDRLKQFIVLPVASAGRQLLGDLSLVAKTGQTHVLTAAVTKLGRDRNNEIILADDTAISRNHACILFIKDGYWLEDLGSTNGTYLNGKKISGRRRLCQGDHIVVGKTELVLVAVERNKELFNEYEVIEEIGRGGMGIVYKALDKKNKRTVAIKQLVLNNIDPRRQQARLQRFKRETVLIQRLNHINIVAVYDVQLGPENFYYVMEFLDGQNLTQELLYRHKFTAADYLPILDQVASALAHAHEQGVVHRDVKPDNIFLLSAGLVKLTDFGIARIAEDIEEANLTRSGAMLGTLAYAAPEQLNDAKKVDHRADIYSLGVVTYEALSGLSPFQGQGITDTVVQVASTREQPLDELLPEINRGTAAVVARAMAKKACDRYGSIMEFAEEFRKALSREDISL